MTLSSPLPVLDAARALERALAAGLDPEADPPRQIVDVPAGQILVMPASARRHAGVKVVTIAPENPAAGRPRIHGVYVLLDGQSLAPVATLDGAELTALRTPAVSAVALGRLAREDARRLVVFGTGPQAWGHVEAVRALRPIAHVAVVGRDRARRDAFVARCRAARLAAEAAEPGAVADADVVCCCTTAREPLFDGALVPDRAAVVAVGSHEPDARELDDALLGRSTVVVEARSAALREAGDVIGAVAAGALDPAALVPLAALVRGGAALPADRPRVFKSVGMAWEDLVVAAAIHERC